MRSCRSAFSCGPQAALHAGRRRSVDAPSSWRLRIASPFIVFAVVVNLAIGLVNRLTPQIPVYFISGPFVIAGGLILFYFVSGAMVAAFMTAFGDWAVRGN